LKINDFLAGLLLGLLATAILLHVATFVNLTGQNVGPAAFPRLLGALLLLCSVILMARGWRQRHAQPWFSMFGWMRSPRHVFNLVLTIAGLLVYITLSDRLGFIVCGLLVLVPLFLGLGVRKLLVLPLALAITLVIHVIFYVGLRVPLPWGVLEAFR
jgi:putative tricarboxylic transport membrane protein